MGAGELGIVYLIVALVAVVAGVLWILLPFAVFGIKPRLDNILAELRQTNAALKNLGDQNRVLVEQQKLMLPRALPQVPKV
jgi:hypothetical protein